MTLLTLKQAAERSGYSVIWLRKLIKLGKLPSSKPGHDRFVDEKDLAALPPRSPRGRPKASKEERT